MKLPALALFERTLRLESRSALMSWSRAGLLALILVVLIQIQSMANIGWYGAPGLRFLQQMVWVNLVFITLAGLSYFASVITEEKEEMMLGLLRMTDLNPVTILLGKSTSRLVGALLLLLVQVPFILLAITLGGVALLQIMAAYGALCAYLFLLSNVALLFSVIFRNTRTASSFTLGFVLVFFFGCYWMGMLQRSAAASNSFHLGAGFWSLAGAAIDLWAQATPVARLGAIFQTGFTGPAFSFQMASNFVMGIVCFFLSWALFDVCTRDAKDAAPARRWFFGRARRLSIVPPSMVGFEVITWKEFRFTCGGKVGLLARFLIMILLIAICNIIAWKTKTHISKEFEGAVLIWISLIVTVVAQAVEASRIFSEEVRWKTLSSLATLPISMRELAYRKVLGALAGTLPLLAFFFIGILLVYDDVVKLFNQSNSDPTFFGFMIVAFLQYILFLHLTAFLSLVIKRGALPLAIAIQYFGGSFALGLMSVFFFRGSADGVLTFTELVSIALTAVLHFAIGRRLAHLAAQE